MKTDKKLKENKLKERNQFNTINLQDIMLEEVFSTDDLEKIIMNRDLLSIFFPTKNSNENFEYENIFKIQEEFEFIDKQSKNKLINLI